MHNYLYERLQKKAWLEQFLIPNSKIDVAVTLTLKQGLPHCGTFERITKEQASQNVKIFLRRLNDEIFGNAARRHRKRLCVVPSIEGDVGGLFPEKRLHVHMGLQFPPAYDLNSNWDHFRFRCLISRCWHKTKWGYETMDYRLCYDAAGWLRYIVKEGSDSIDIENAHLTVQN